MSDFDYAKISLASRPMMAVMIAQFMSAFGDNVLLFAILALLKQQFWPDWSQPILQIVFVATYILLAPFVGQIADSFSKGRGMMLSNNLKFFGALIIFYGANPFLGYCLVGVGAAAYSPAKYGILNELTRDELLVKANGLMEASTIAAILLGSVTGGALADINVLNALVVCIVAYGMALAANTLIPRLLAARPACLWRLGRCQRSFFMPARFFGRMGRVASH
ncbi:MFS transporter, LPLT family, lysophospholipid transporter [Izhakiella capsodis]|uniref:MFS transporter, LPLT family, lysophospholipid transporter n=1 Tax=Izhakiella capsodis TaxID=1367852 RepID=A0A1I4W565_9GAMM|nr:MFS transporter, LPLT family, lysophospholipid transporter [Izhakiella capsodis]